MKMLEGFFQDIHFSNFLSLSVNLLGFFRATLQYLSQSWRILKFSASFLEFFEKLLEFFDSLSFLEMAK